MRRQMGGWVRFLGGVVAVLVQHSNNEGRECLLATVDLDVPEGCLIEHRDDNLDEA